MKKIDVLLPIYNEPLDYVSKSVQSILNQTYKDFKLIVIFDSPSNLEVINYVEELKTIDSRIFTIKNEKNLGLVASLNKGIVYCTDDYVALMDADDISEPDRFETQLKYLEENDLDFISSNVIWFNDEKNLCQYQIPTSSNEIKKMLKHGSIYCHPTFFFKREILDKVKYENALYCEDYLFVIRLVENNYKLGNCPEYLLKYRINKNGICSSNTTKQYAYAKYLRKNYKRKRKIVFSNFEDYIFSSKTIKYIEKMNLYFHFKKEFVLLKNKPKKMLYLARMFFISPLDFLHMINEKLFYNQRSEYK